MVLSNKEMAVGLAVPHSRVAEWVKRGMPRDSIEAARSWRMLHARPRGYKPDPISVADLGLPPKEAVVVPQDKGWDARLERARTTELEAHKALMLALAAGDLLTLQKLQAVHIASIKEIAAAEKIALEVRSAAKELIHIDRVRATMSSALMPVRDAMDKLPLGERANCNPDHPEVAERALTEWRDRLINRLNALMSKI